MITTADIHKFKQKKNKIKKKIKKKNNKINTKKKKKKKGNYFTSYFSLLNLFSLPHTASILPFKFIFLCHLVLKR